MALGDVIARLSVHLGLETAAFEKGSNKAKREVSGLERHVSRAGAAIKTAFVGMLGAFAVGQIVEVARAGLEYASSLGEVAAQLGVTTKALQEYRYAASQAGVEQGEMDQALAQLTRRLGDAADGAKEPTAALEKLGVSLRDAEGQVISAGDAIPLIAEGLKSIESPAERAAILVDLFGKAGQKLAPLLEGGAAGVNNLRNAAHELGIVLSDEQIQKADDTADKLAAMKQVLEAKIAGAVADNADSIVELADALTKLVEAAGKAAKAWRYFSNLDWSPGAGSFSEQFSRMQMRDLGPGVELTDSVKAAVAARRAAPFAGPSGGPLRSVPKRAPAPAMSSPWGNLNTNLNRRSNAVGAFGGQDFSKFTPGAGAGFIRMAQEANDLAKPMAEVDKLVENMAVRNAPRLLDSLTKMTAETMELRSATQGILDRLFPDQAEARRYAEEVTILNTALAKTQITAETHAQAILALRREYQGFGEAVAMASEIVRTTFGPTLDEISDSISDRLPDALGEMAGKSSIATVRVAESFADMAQDVLGSLNQLSSSIKGGGFLDILSSVIGVGLSLGKAGAFGSDFAASLNRIPGNANGTNSWRGGMSWVGERGPELVNLPRGSQVIPNNKLNGMGGDTYYLSGNLLTPEFWAQIESGDVGAARAGAAGGVASLQNQSRRRYA